MMTKLTKDMESQLKELYGNNDSILLMQQDRYARLLSKHQELFGKHNDTQFVSAPGRIEICGNHTDHNRGMVLAAAVSLDTLAVISPRQDTLVSVHSEGHQPVTLDIEALSMIEAEKGTATAMVRGVARWLKEYGFRLGGFDAVTHSTVLPGSGLSSSAAFEVLIIAIFDTLFNQGTIDPVQRAQCAQYAENEYFGKPSGLMDQMASSMGAMITIDFATDQPEIEAISYDFAKKGYAIVVVDTGGNHGDLTDFYAAIPKEMHAVAQFFGNSVLREVAETDFFNSIPALRKTLPPEICDRAILRAQHYYEENRRVENAADALRSNNLNAFFATIIASGKSSALYLQNTYATPDKQEIMLGLMTAETLLQGKGAWRVHGGGFAGTTLNFVPIDMLDRFIKTMDALFGENASTALSIRPHGPVVLSTEAE